MCRFLNLGGANLIGLFGNSVSVWYGSAQYYIDLIMVEVIYNERQVSQIEFGNWLVFVKRGLRFHNHFG